MNYRFFFTIIIVLSRLNAFGQVDTLALQKDFKELMKLDKIIYYEMDFCSHSEDWGNVIDKSIPKFEIKLTKFLTKYHFKSVNLKLLHTIGNIVTDNDSNVAVINWGYESGGTKGMVDYSIIQYHLDSQNLAAYNLTSQRHIKHYDGYSVACKKIYRLPLSNKELYLLIGDAQGNSTAMWYQALVIQISGKYIILDYPAFHNNESIIDFNCDEGKKIYYNKQNGVLIIDKLSCGNVKTKFKFNKDRFTEIK